jgi:hypothetical protein
MAEVIISARPHLQHLLMAAAMKVIRVIACR